MLQIGNGQELRVAKDRRRDLERNAVLTRVAGGLDVVPLELELLVQP